MAGRYGSSAGAMTAGVAFANGAVAGSRVCRVDDDGCTGQADAEEGEEEEGSALPSYDEALSADVGYGVSNSFSVETGSGDLGSHLPEAALTDAEAIHIAQVESLATQAGWDEREEHASDAPGVGMREEVMQFLRVTGSEDSEVSASVEGRKEASISCVL